MFPWNLTIAANETMPVAASGSFVYVDKATGPVKLEAYNEGKRVAEVPLSFAREANLPFFTKLYVTDTSGAENTVRLLVGGENEGYERNGSEITGPVGPAGGVQVEDPDGGGESFAEVIAELAKVVTETQNVLALLKNDLDQRAPLNTIAGATFAEAIASTNTLVTAASNTNGVVIRLLTVTVDSIGSGAANGFLVIGVDKLRLARVDSANIFSVGKIERLFIPPGVDVQIESDAQEIQVDAYFEVL